MVKSSTNPLSFLSGFVQDRNTGRVIAQVDELKDAGSTSCWLMKWTRLDRKWYSFDLSWHATRMCVLEKPHPHLLAVGPAGIVSVNTPKGDEEEEIDSTEDGPKRRGDIRDLRAIGEHAYVVGMSRQVYRREGPGQWVRKDQGVVQPRGTLDLAGFNAIDGLDELDLYAVGFGGEIWHCHNNNWHKLDSPSNLVLLRVRVVNKELVYVSGQQGTILRGQGHHFKAIKQDVTKDDFWGMEWYRDQLYVACDSGIYVLTDGNDLLKVDMGLANDITFRHLHANDGVMFSFGPKHIVWTEDGLAWHDITP